MCGRYSITTPVEALRQLFLFEALPNLQPRYNVAPSQEVPAVRLASPEDEEGGEKKPQRRLVMLRWGLIPFWARDAKIAYKTINARSLWAKGHSAKAPCKTSWNWKAARAR